MKGSQHLFLGTVAGIAGSEIYAGTDAGIPFCLACMAGSLFPDIDLQTSKAGNIIWPISGLLNKTFGHRGFIHTPLNGAIMSLAVYALTNLVFLGFGIQIATGFALGFFLHLLQDTVTRGGIMWLWPLKIKIHLTNIRSNDIWCWPITAIFAAICACIVYFAKQAGYI